MITRCKSCLGSGQIMGGGMINTLDCPQCNGTGKPIIIDYEKAKQTKSYSNAKKRLKTKNPHLSDYDAEKLLDKELQGL